MNFLKGTILGIAVGTYLGFNNEDKIDEMIRCGKRKYKRMMKKYPYNIF